MNNQLKIIIDVDTGVDDALALILAAKSYLNEVIGVTTCGGNANLEQVTKNTLAVLELAGVSWPVYKGSEKNLADEDFIYGLNFHGENGLANIDLGTNRQAEDISAVDFIIGSAKKYKNLIFVCLAPSTNLAKALIKAPEIRKSFSKVIMMGGAVKVPGNQGPFAEFNFFQDPSAVKEIFDQIENVLIVPLDVTCKCPITKDDLDKFSASAVASFAKKMIESWYGYFGDKHSRQLELYDPLALSAIDSEFLSFTKDKFEIVTSGEKKGALIEGDREISYASDVKARKFVQYFIDSINRI